MPKVGPSEVWGYCGQPPRRCALALLAAVTLALVVGCAGSRPGDPAVYARIETETDCAVLQREFDVAMDNTDARQPGDPLRDISLSYAEAADNRLSEVGCYG